VLVQQLAEVEQRHELVNVTTLHQECAVPNVQDLLPSR